MPDSWNDNYNLVAAGEGIVDGSETTMDVKRPVAPFSVSAIGFGAMPPGRGRASSGRPTITTEALAVLRQAVDLGVDHIDTAQFYGPDVVDKLVPRGAPSLPRGPHPGQQGRRSAGRRWPCPRRPRTR